MNTITLNGVSSSTIQGLLIQELPPISKPKIRTQTEDIDGRDGDIVTRLGYSAYDKEIKIGLTYGYDVDDVIAYFDSQGIVIFSNEPDKYYNYQINDQIDFERLIRFKQAKVKFHVQPFKYKVGEEPVTYTPETETVSGSIVTFDGTAGTSIKSLVAQIEPKQEGSGDPSPTNVRPISGWSGVNVSQTPYPQTEKHTITGKNLYNAPNNTNGTIIPCHIDANQSFVASANISCGIRYYNVNKTQIDFWSSLPNTSEDGRKYRVISSSTAIEYVEFYGSGSIKDLMVELGSAPSPYEPYGEGYNIPFKDSEGNPITVYGGEIDVVSGKLTIGREAPTLNEMNISHLDSGYFICYPLHALKRYGTNAGQPDAISSCFYRRAGSALIDNLQDNIFTVASANIDESVMAIRANNYSSVADLKSALGTNRICYELATPIEITLTPTEVNTLLGTNNIWADSGEVSVGIVKADLTAVNEGNIFAKPTLYLEGSGTVGVLVNGEEALSIDMSEIPHITIDVPEMNAYYDTELANRKVTGDPDDLFLDVGTDTISFTGNVTKAELTEYSRWI